jgi:hypothetical protein
MRVIGIVAVFVLALAAIVEGAVIVRLSTRIDTLADKLATPPAAPRELSDVRAPHHDGVALARGDGAGVGLPPPRLTGPAGAPVPTAPATAMLAEALQTVEGRQHLRGAIEHLREEERQDRLVRNAEQDIEREQRYRDRMAKVLSLPAHEQEKVGQLFATLQAGRRKVLDDMRAGLKNAEQADDEIDNLEDGTQAQVRALLGDQRMQQLRDARRAERGRGGQGGGQGGGQEGGGRQGQQRQGQQGQPQGNAPGTTPPGAPAPQGTPPT